MSYKTSSENKISSSSAITSSARLSGPVIVSVAVTDSSYNVLDDTAVGSSGGNIRILGSGFTNSALVYVNGSAVSTIYVSPTELCAVLAATAVGTYLLMVFNSTGAGAIYSPGITFSGFPIWTSANYSSTSFTINIQLLATGEAPLIYELQSGSTLPAGITLSSTGLLSGTIPTQNNGVVYSFTMLVSDAQLQTTQQTINLSVVQLDPYFKSTTLLLTGDTSPVPFTSDASTNNFELTPVGTPSANTNHPFQAGYYSNYFDGSSYLTTPSTGQFAPAGAFTISFWYYPVTISTQVLLGNYTGGASTNWDIEITSTGRLDVYTNSSTIRISSAVGAITTNQWYYISLIRDASNVITLYINSTAIGTYSQTGTFGSTSLPIAIGSNITGTAKSNCYLSGVFLNDGNAIVGVPTTPRAAIVGTSLLTCQSNRFMDNSANNFTLTATGTPSVSQNQPFTKPTTWDAVGSAYFGTANNYINGGTSSALALGSGDFTVELWIYLTQYNSSTSVLLDWRDSGGGGPTNVPIISIGTTGTLGYYIGNGSVPTVLISSTSTLGLNVWNHFALVRAGSTNTMYLNGISVGTASNSTALSTITFNINNQQAINYLAYGYLSNLRIVKGIAVYTSAFTPPTTPLTAIANTALLTVQTPQAQNNSQFRDSSLNNFAITRTGTPTQGAFSPFSPTGWSVSTGFFNSAYSFLVAAPSSNITLDSSSHFTIEAWINIRSGTGSRIIISLGGTPSADWGLGVTGVNNNLFFTTQSADSNSSTPILYNTWTHVAAVYDGYSIKLYVNGTQVLSDFNPPAVGLETQLYIGAGGAAIFDGNISNLRVVKGVSVYTGAFSPPTGPLAKIQSAGTNISAITGSQTALLTCQDNRFKDNSNYGLAVNVGNGFPSIQAFSPFAPAAAYSPAVYGGSGYLNGSTAYASLTAADGNTALTVSAFTMEAWVYPTQADWILAAKTPNSNGVFQWYLGGSASGIYLTFQQYGSSTASASSGIAIQSNAWSHIVVQRRGDNTMDFYTNGVLSGSTSNGFYGGYIGYDLTNSGLLLIGNTNFGKTGGVYVSNFRITKTRVYSSNFTPSTINLPAITGTSLLLNFTNAGIADASARNDLTTVGDARISTAVKKYGTGSLYFDGTGDWIYSPARPLNAIGSADFTLECWIFVPSPSDSPIFESRSTDGSTDGFTLTAFSSTVIRVYTSSALITGTITNYSNIWTHVAVVRAGTTTTLYINGSSVGTTTSLGSLTNTDFAVGGGRYGSGAAIAKSFPGYIDDFRITRGQARYTANFTPLSSSLQLQ